MRSLRFYLTGLVSRLENTVHASRLRYYAGSHLEVLIRLQGKIQHDQWKFVVEHFIDFREEGKTEKCSPNGLALIVQSGSPWPSWWMTFHSC